MAFASLPPYVSSSVTSRMSSNGIVKCESCHFIMRLSFIFRTLIVGVNILYIPFGFYFPLLVLAKKTSSFPLNFLPVQCVLLSLKSLLSTALKIPSMITNNMLNVVV